MRALLLLAVLTLLPLTATAQCRQALALGLDVSGSVDSAEYTLQLQGIAGALRNPEVIRALTENPSAPVELAIYEWSGREYQNILVAWTPIRDRASLEAIARQLETAPRIPAPPVTALGDAMAFGAALLNQRPGCWKRTLDISGDGRSNAGPQPQAVRDSLRAQDLTLNGLVVGNDDSDGNRPSQIGIAELSAYFEAYVILGPEAFVETALGFADIEDAMVRKLLRELVAVTADARREPPRFR